MKGEISRSRIANPTPEEIKAIQLWMETLSFRKLAKITARAIDQGITVEKAARPAWMVAKKRMAGGF